MGMGPAMSTAASHVSTSYGDQQERGGRERGSSGAVSSKAGFVESGGERASDARLHHIAGHWGSMTACVASFALCLHRGLLSIPRALNY